MAEISKLALHSGSNLSWTVEQMLEDALADIRSGSRTANKALVIFLDDENRKYNIGFTMAQLSASQAIALMRVQECEFLRLMDRI